VQNQLEDRDNKFSSFIFGAVGFKIGRYREGLRNSWGNIEIQLPYLLLTEKSFAFVGNDYVGGGIQFSYIIPIGKNVPIGSK
jgi:hypothetical protein